MEEEWSREVLIPNGATIDWPETFDPLFEYLVLSVLDTLNTRITD